MNDMNGAPRGERITIGFFGRRNVGKSSLINAFASQDISIVSDAPGTTTDPVTKAMELLPAGAVTLIDTPGSDDDGILGRERVSRTMDVLRRVDVAVLVTDGGIGEHEKRLMALFEEQGIPYLTVHSKCDMLSAIPDDGIYVSARDGTGIDRLRHAAAELCLSAAESREERHIAADLVSPGDVVVLCIPIDEAAPKGRLILPQSAVLRDLIGAGVTVVSVRDTELRDVFGKLSRRPSLVITDSQAFAAADRDTPDDIPLTSFSILMARYKGFLDMAVRGAQVIDTLPEGSRILISEGCTHRRQCGDIGTVKLPRLLERRTGKTFDHTFTSGGTFPEDVTTYDLIIHCGGCMLTEREVRSRMRSASLQHTPVTNYGIALAHLNGILERALSPFS